MTTLAAKQDENLERNSEKLAKAVVTSSQHDTSKTKINIDEYSALLEKYTAACVVRNSAETVALKEKEELEKRVR